MLGRLQACHEDAHCFDAFGDLRGRFLDAIDSLNARPAEVTARDHPERDFSLVPTFSRALFHPLGLPNRRDTCMKIRTRGVTAPLEEDIMEAPSAVFFIAGILVVLVVLLGAMGIVRVMRGRRPIPLQDQPKDPNEPPSPRR